MTAACCCYVYVYRYMRVYVSSSLFRMNKDDRLGVIIDVCLKA